MSHSNFGFGATAGALLGMLFTTGVAVAIRDQGREECDQKLPRTEKCVQQWVPETTKPAAKEGNQK